MLDSGVTRRGSPSGRRLSLHDFFGLLRTAAVEWYEDDPFRLSASLAFYTIFSMAPILLIAVYLASFWFGAESTRRHVLEEVSFVAGPEAARALGPVLSHAGEQAANSLPALYGLLLLAIGSTAVFGELQSALNRIWDVTAAPRRGFLLRLIRVRLQSLAIVLAVGFLLLVSLVLSAVLSAAQEYFAGQLGAVPELWRALNLFVSFAMTTGLFALIYKLLPDVRIAWRDVAVGALATAVLFTGGKYGIGLYLGQTSFASYYGAAGSFVVLLAWVYYAALICFYGAEITQVFARRFGSRIEPEPHAERVGRKDDAV